MNLIVLIVIAVWVGGVATIAIRLSAMLGMSLWLTTPVAIGLGAAAWWLFVTLMKLIDVRVQKRRGRTSRL